MLEFIKQFFKPSDKVFDSFPKTDQTSTPIPPTLPPTNQLQDETAKIAYHMAELDGFKDSPINYWIKAEEQVKRNNS